MKDLLVAVMIVVLFASFTTAVSPPETGEQMSDIVEKLSQNQPLDAQEQQRLRLALQNLEVVSQWIGADGQPNIPSAHIRVPEFEIIPLGFNGMYQTTQAVPNNANTEIDFDATSTSFSNQYSVVDLTNNKITCIVTHRFFFYGRVLWEANATGDRKIIVTLYNQDDTVSDSRVISAIKSASIETVETFSYSYGMTKGQYLKFEVVQNSGIEIDVSFSMTMFAVV